MVCAVEDAQAQGGPAEHLSQRLVSNCTCLEKLYAAAMAWEAYIYTGRSRHGGRAGPMAEAKCARRWCAGLQGPDGSGRRGVGADGDGWVKDGREVEVQDFGTGCGRRR